MKKGNFFLLILLLQLSVLYKNGMAQMGFAYIGVNGLTCSQCSRSVEMSLKKLKFVDKVEMELVKAEGKVYFKPGMVIDLDQVAQAVYDAGFAVRFLKVELDFNLIPLEGSCFKLASGSFQILEQSVSQPKNRRLVQLVGKKYLPAKEWKVEKLKLVPLCPKENLRLYFIHLL